jgi:hypothetical protein
MNVPVNTPQTMKTIATRLGAASLKWSCPICDPVWAVLPLQNPSPSPKKSEST